jgi:hypothetical protein
MLMLSDVLLPCRHDGCGHQPSAGAGGNHEQLLLQVGQATRCCSGSYIQRVLLQQPDPRMTIKVVAVASPVDLQLTCVWPCTHLLPLPLSGCLPAAARSVWFMFAGFFLPYSAMPAWWSWIYWVNPLSYMLYGIIASQLGDVTSTIVVGPGQVTTVQLLLKGEQLAACECKTSKDVITWPSPDCPNNI